MRLSLVVMEVGSVTTSTLPFQFLNLLPHGIDAHADGFADGPVAGPVLIQGMADIP